MIEDISAEGSRIKTESEKKHRTVFICIIEKGISRLTHRIQYYTIFEDGLFELITPAVA